MQTRHREATSPEPKTSLIAYWRSFERWRPSGAATGAESESAAEMLLRFKRMQLKSFCSELTMVVDEVDYGTSDHRSGALAA